MLPKSVIACLAASAFATGALIPTGASAAKGGPSPGTWNWPPYAGIGGGMPGKPMRNYNAGRALSSQAGQRAMGLPVSLEVGQILVSAKACRVPGTGQKSEPLQQA
jgi:hypothetical protein